MRVSGLIAVLALVAAPFGVAPSIHAADPADREAMRIRAHFDSVLTELTARDIDGLSPSQRNNRSRLMLTLANYRDRGVFPHNYDFPGQAVPYFVDRKTGTLCAVAHLLESTGRRDIVDRVAHDDNNVWVAELAADTALVSWLDGNGLTLDEAARIQVPYVGDPAPAPPVRGSSGSRSETMTYVAIGVGVPVTLATAAVTTWLNTSSNADGHRRAVSWAGAVTGGMIALGGSSLLIASRNNGTVQAVGASSLVLGGLGVFAASRAMHEGRRIARAHEQGNTNRVGQTSIAPIVTGSLNNPAVGASLSLRF